MTDTPSSEQSIFLAALERKDAAERAAYLNEACGDNEALRAGVQALLDAHEKGDDFLERQPAVGETASFAPLTEGPGTVIGPYKLLQQIGEGGMGVVFMAEQEKPVRRRVALKVIKPGMDSRQVVTRFEAERQALALMDHQNIARVLDAGATATGRPYFVMELVHGVPITTYCDDNHLTPRERLELFVPVCQAVQHAHQKGVIHRDLKSSNVLVCLYDGKPVPKVIDFGVAKATQQRLTEKTMFTQFGTVVGTLEYMAPEQAEASQLGVDTRSDVYSLGVLLYELLTGTTPLERKRLREAALDEVLRIIREEEPPRPSTRLSGSGKLPAIAAARKTEPAKLSKLVRGELDWIVMKALEKDRSRRYETANGFARDVQRYLADEPVEACPPSPSYRLRKFARKYRKPLATAATFLVLAVLAGALTTWQAVRLARADRDAAERERDETVHQAKRVQDIRDALAQAQTVREQARAANDRGRWAEARAMVKRAEALLEGGSADEELAGRIHDALRELDQEEKDRRMVETLEKIREESSNTRDTALRYAEAFRQYGLEIERLPVAEAAAQVRRSMIREDLLAALNHWTYDKRAYPGIDKLRAVADEADDNAWRRALRAASAANDTTRLKQLANDSQVLDQPPGFLWLFGAALFQANLAEEAVVFWRKAQQRYPADFWINFNLAVKLSHMRPARYAEALGYFRAALARRPDSSGSYLGLGQALKAQGDLPGAIACNRKALEIAPTFAEAHNNLGNCLEAQKDRSGAMACYRKAIEANPKLPQPYFNLGRNLGALGDLGGAIAIYRQGIEFDPKHPQIYFSLASALNEQGDLPGAITSYRKAIEIDPKYAEAHCNLGNLLLQQGEFAAALAALQTGHQLGTQRGNWSNPSEQWVRKAIRMVELEAQLREFLSGQRMPIDATERADLGDLCRYKKNYAVSARFYTDAFAADATLADDLKAGYRYNAACSAVLAAAGQGHDADQPDEAERTRLRRQARVWLRANLDQWAKLLATDKPQDRVQIQRAMRGRQNDPDLTSVRDAAALAKLPADEREAWQKLWAEVAELLKKAEAK
jgi:serine/threonine protein kinase/tetratricopeptide (TPR) repeat protein